MLWSPPVPCGQTKQSKRRFLYCTLILLNNRNKRNLSFRLLDFYRKDVRAIRVPAYYKRLYLNVSTTFYKLLYLRVSTPFYRRLPQCKCISCFNILYLFTYILSPMELIIILTSYPPISSKIKQSHNRKQYSSSTVSGSEPVPLVM